MLFKKHSPGDVPASKDVGLLGAGTQFEGTIRFGGTLRIDGVVRGDIVSEPGGGSVLIINQQATVTGNIVSDSVLISGKVKGDVRALERVEIFRSGTLSGEIYTHDIMIEAGAAFEGYCHMDEGQNGAGEGKPLAQRASRTDGPSEAAVPGKDTKPASV